MIQENIIREVCDELTKGIKNKCQVVYILSLVVILLEDREQKEYYPYLLFYRNWTMHNKLSMPNTVKLLGDIFKDGIDLEISAHMNARNLIKTNGNFFKLDTLKDEFTSFFKEDELTLNLFNRNWSSFKKLLLEVIKEHPVEFSSETLKKLEVVKNENKDYCYKFTLVGRKDKPIVKLKF